MLIFDIHHAPQHETRLLVLTVLSKFERLSKNKKMFLIWLHWFYKDCFFVIELDSLFQVLHKNVFDLTAWVLQRLFFFVIELDSLFQVLHDIEYVFGKTSDSGYKGLRQVICFCCQAMYSTIHDQLFPWLRVSWHCLFSTNPNLFQIWLLFNKVPSKLCCTFLILTTGKNEKCIKTICSSQ